MPTLILPDKINRAAALKQWEKDRCEDDLSYFIRKAWPILEPENPYYHNWHIDMIAMHLAAITNEEVVDGKLYRKLLINVPPGFMKSLMCSVFWPAWEWGPKNKASMRYLLLSHDMSNPERDAGKLRRLIESDWYSERWPIQFRADQNAKRFYENTKTGFVLALTAGSVTGKRGDRVILDDAMSWDDANSETVRESTINWFAGALQGRINKPSKSAFVVVEQRLHEEDISGIILDRQLGYDHIRLPMRYDETFPMPPTMLGLVDPRSKHGEMLFPSRFPEEAVTEMERGMNPYNIAGQHQQVPTPEGGGIIHREWWRVWQEEQFPELDYILASLDTAYGEKQENDYSAMTIWGVFTVDTTAFNAPTRTLSRYGTEQQIERVYNEGAPQVILMHAWRERLPFNELVHKVLKSCRKYKIDRLLVEDKAVGPSVVQELRRVISYEEFGISTTNPKGEKWHRLNAVSYLWCDGKDPQGKWVPGMVWAPDKEWAEMVIREVEMFPKGKHDDLTDTVSQAAKYLRDNGLLTRAPERLQEIEDSKVYLGSRVSHPLYPA